MTEIQYPMSNKEYPIMKDRRAARRPDLGHWKFLVGYSSPPRSP